MPGNDLRDIYVFQTRRGLDRPQTCDCVDAARSRTKEVAEHPVVLRVAVDESSSNSTAYFEPSLLGGSDRRAKDENVLDNTVCSEPGELYESVEYCSCSKGKANQRDRTNTGMSLNQGVGEDQSCCAGSIKCIRPRIVNKIAEFGKNYPPSDPAQRLIDRTYLSATEGHSSRPSSPSPVILVGRPVSKSPRSRF